MKEKSNIVGFPSTDGWCKQVEDENENEPMQMAFICHIYGYNPDNEKQIVERVSELLGKNNLSPTITPGEMIFIETATTLRDVYFLKSVVYVIDKVIFSANQDYCFISCCLFNAGLAYSLVSLPRDVICLTPKIKNSMVKWSDKVKNIFEQIHDTSGIKKTTEKIVEILNRTIMSFGPINPDSIQFLNFPNIKNQYLRMEWALLNSNLAEDDDEEEPEKSYSYFVTPKYFLEGASSLEEMAAMLDSQAEEFRSMAKTNAIEMQEAVQGGHGFLFTTDADVAERFGFNEDEE
jgi:hypothetical protein